MISLPAVVDHTNAMLLRQAGLKQIKEGASRVDGSALADFDSSILAILLEWRRFLPELVVEQVPEKLKVLARVYGVSELFQFKEA